MVYAFTQDVPIDTDMYARITDAMGDEPMDGLLMHLCVRNPDGGLRYIDVWESEEQCTRAFEERVHPAVDKAFGGRRPPGEPTVKHPAGIQGRGAPAGGAPGLPRGPQVLGRAPPAGRADRQPPGRDRGARSRDGRRPRLSPCAATG